MCVFVYSSRWIYMFVHARFSGQKSKFISSMTKTLFKSAVAQGAYLCSLLDSFAVDIVTVGFHQTIPR